MPRRPDRPVRTPGLFDPPRSAAPSGGEAAAGSKAQSGSSLPRRTVAELTHLIKERLGEFGRMRVEGEISGFKRHTSGHLYFDLKDERARISCVIWRSTVARGLGYEPKEGDRVLATARLDVYEPRGTYKLIVDRLEALGIGALLAKLEELKADLARRGWFERKRPLPRYPRCVGVVTSRDGAALRDFLRTRSLRWPGYPVRLCHAAVQGPGAAEDIADAVRRLDRSGVDVLVVCRGGGSLEDLWAFNELPVAEAIHEASVPVVSGVGHESDTTLADLVADHRAHTPTDAAQAVIPDRAQLYAGFARAGNYLIDAMERVVSGRAERLTALGTRPALRDADWILDVRGQRLATLWARLRPILFQEIEAGAKRQVALERRLERASPEEAIRRWRRRLERSGTRLVALGTRALERTSERLAADARALEAVSPLAVLGRGFSLSTREGAATPLKDAGVLAPGDEVRTRLSRGAFRARVEEVFGPEELGSEEAR